MTARTPSARSGTRRPSQLRLVFGGVAMVGLAVAIALLTLQGQTEQATLDDIAGSPAIEGEWLPPVPPDPADDVAVGAPAPVVTGAGFDGTTTTIGQAGRPRLITFMAAWCPHCQDELPEVAEWLGDGRAPGDLEVVAVATGLDPERPNWPPDAWFDEVGYPGPVLVDDADGSVGAAYGLTGTPYWVGLDREGRVVVRLAGRIGPDVLDQLADYVHETG